jgi:hypothetical protein
MSNTPLAWLAAFGGSYLVYAAVRGRHPVADLRAGLTGQATAPTKAFASGGSGGGDTGGGGTVSGSHAAAASGGPVVPQSSTVSVATTTGSYGKTILLVPDAARAFHSWQSAYGAPIPCGEGWRSAAAADAGHAKDPQRFADSAHSWHCKGAAVDVDNNWLSTLPPAQLSKLRTTARSAGWLQARSAGEARCGSGDTAEPWHFSYGGCG